MKTREDGRRKTTRRRGVEEKEKNKRKTQTKRRKKETKIGKDKDPTTTLRG